MDEPSNTLEGDFQNLPLPELRAYGRIVETRHGPQAIYASNVGPGKGYHEQSDVNPNWWRYQNAGSGEIRWACRHGNYAITDSVAAKGCRLCGEGPLHDIGPVSDEEVQDAARRLTLLLNELENSC